MNPWYFIFRISIAAVNSKNIYNKAKIPLNFKKIKSVIALFLLYLFYEYIFYHFTLDKTGRKLMTAQTQKKTGNLGTFAGTPVTVFFEGGTAQ